MLTNAREGANSVLRITCLTHFSIVIATCWIFRRYVDCFQREFLNIIIRHVHRWVNRHATELWAFNLRVIILVSYLGLELDFPLFKYFFLPQRQSYSILHYNSVSPVLCVWSSNLLSTLLHASRRMCPDQISSTVWSSLIFSIMIEIFDKIREYCLLLTISQTCNVVSESIHLFILFHFNSVR